MPEKLKSAAKRLKRETLVAYYAARDPRTSWAVKLLAAAVAAYALSPIDLIPDFIPVLGMLDDLILIPLGVALVIRFLPESVIADARIQANASSEKPISWIGAALITAVWLAVVWLIARKWL